MRPVLVTITTLAAIAAWADVAPRPPSHGGMHSIAFVVAGIVTASLITIVRKLRKAAREDQAKTDNQVKSGMAKYSNCMDCPEHELWALRDPDDWFSHDTRISCRAANGRNIADSVPSGFFRECAAVSAWCPRRNARSQAKL